MDIVVRLSALGDIIHTAIILEFLPEKVSWLVEEKFSEILEYNPNIENIEKVNLSQLKKSKLAIFDEYRRVKKLSYSRALDFQGLIKSAVVSKIISKDVVGMAEVREKLAKLFYSRTLKSSNHTIDRYRLMINQIYNLNISQDDFKNHSPFLHYKDKDFTQKRYFSKKKDNIIFIIGSNGENRLYPKERWIELANRLDGNILIPYGNSQELEMAKEIAKNSSAKVLDRVSLNELKATISNANLLIGNDTGPSYIGWANNIPTILLFGTTPISRVFENRTTKVIKSKTAKYLDKLDKYDFSIRDITVDEILKGIDEIFG